MNCSLSLVIPIYNEEGNIPKLITNVENFFSNFGNDHEVIFVDDGSTDGSNNLINSKKNENMRIVSHKDNKGYGEALKTGFKESKYDLIGYIDGDNQIRVNTLDKLLDYIDGYDLVIGERKNRNDNLRRKLISRYFNYLVRKRLNVSFKDVNCGIKVFRRELFDSIELYTERTIDAELIAKAEKKDFEIKQVDVEHLERDKGNSEAKGILGVRKKLINTTLQELDQIEDNLNND